MKKLLSIVALASGALLCTGTAAFADPGEIDLSQTLYTLSSPGNTYGPWNITTLRAATHVGNDTPSVTLVNRSDNDRPLATHSQSLLVDDYHDWSKGFFTYAQAGISSGNILPTRSLYVEGDWKLPPTQNFVIGAGGSALKNPDGTHTNYLSVGPTIYDGAFSTTLRYMPSWTSGVSAGSFELTFEHNVPSNHDATLSFLHGTEPSFLAGAPVATVGIFQRVTEVDAAYKKWVRPDFGYQLGVSYGVHNDRDTGAQLYTATGITLGLFFGRIPQ